MAEVINFSNLPKWRRRLNACSFKEKVIVLTKAAHEWLWERYVGIIPEQRDYFSTLIVEQADEILNKDLEDIDLDQLQQEYYDKYCTEGDC